MHDSSNARAYWQANIRWLIGLLAIWAVVSFGCGIWLKEPLDEFHLGGYPLGFWFAQQGSIYVFVILIFVYARVMERLDRRFGLEEDSQ